MDTTSRSHLTILDLPDELIDQVLAEVKWGAPAPTFELDGLQFYENLTRHTDTASIQRVRLTCRRLASRASALLLPVAWVSISDPSSVDRLEQIASHGAFSLYVRAVHVYFDFYEAGLAADIQKLAGHLLPGVLGQVISLSAEATTAPRPLGYRTGAIWNRIIDEWDAFSRGEEWDGGDDAAHEEEKEGGGESESMQLLRRDHAEYQRRYEAQQRLGESVVERIAKAMARMPQATRLILDDGPETPTAAGEEGLITPMSWAMAFKSRYGAPPIKTLFALPVAAHRAGVELTGLHIHRLRLPSRFPLWLPPAGEGHSPWLSGPPPREAEELRAACGSLRVFEFTPGYEPHSQLTASPTHLEWPDMSRWSRHQTWLDILDCILGSRSLRQVRIDLQAARWGELHHIIAMPHPPWPHIRVLELQNGIVETSNLSDFLSATAGTLVRLHLDGMFLHSNSYGIRPFVRPAPYSWSSVLDMLRTHCHRARSEHGSSGGGGDDYTKAGLVRSAAVREPPLIYRIRQPRGAEFEDYFEPVIFEADMAHIKALFEPDDDGGSGLSAVDRFIQGLSDCNPLVEAGKTPLLYPV